MVAVGIEVTFAMEELSVVQGNVGEEERRDQGAEHEKEEDCGHAGTGGGTKQGFGTLFPMSKIKRGGFRMEDERLKSPIFACGNNAHEVAILLRKP